MINNLQELYQRRDTGELRDKQVEQEEQTINDTAFSFFLGTS